MYLLVSAFMMGAVSGARGWSSYVNYLTGDIISNFTKENIGVWDNMDPLSEYPDLVGFGLVLILTAIVAGGIQCSTKVTAVITFVNIIILLFVSILGFVYADVSNWTLEGKGFMPYGFSGVVMGAFACFWALSGFETISTSVEEAKDPQKSVPWATGISLIIVTVLYIAMSSAVTLVMPYDEIDRLAPLPSAFADKDIHWAVVISSIGPIFGLTTTSLNGVFGSARIAYAIALDGFFPQSFAYVNSCSQVPIVSVVVLGFFMAIVTLLINIETVIDFGIVMVLFTYIQVCCGVIMLRYQPMRHQDEEADDVKPGEQNHLMNKLALSDTKQNQDTPEEQNQLMEKPKSQNVDVECVIPNSKRKGELETGSGLTAKGLILKDFTKRINFLNKTALALPKNWTTVNLCMSILVEIGISLVVHLGASSLLLGMWWAWLVVGCLIVLLILLLLSFYMFEQNTHGLILKVCICLFDWLF